MHSVCHVKLSKSISKTSKYLQRMRNNSKCRPPCIFLGYEIIYTLTSVCTAFVMLNWAKASLKRRNISNGWGITANLGQICIFLGYDMNSTSKFSVWHVKWNKGSPKTSKYLQQLRNNNKYYLTLHFSGLWDDFDIEVGMYSVWHVKWSKGSPETSKYIQQVNNNSKLMLSLHFSGLWDNLEFGIGMHSSCHVKLSKSSSKTSKYLQRVRNNSICRSHLHFSHL
jgi:hypothetical protein